MSKRNHIALLLLCMAPLAFSATVNKVPEGFTPCANDFEICETADNWTGYYGANSTFVEIAGSKSFTCLPQTFGINDPLPNVRKSCFIKNTGLLNGLMACGVDGERCDIVGQWTGQYGANNSYAEISGSGAFTCLPQSFGISDPLPNVQKTCYIKQVCPARRADASSLNYWLAMNNLERFTELLQQGYNPDELTSGSGLPYSNLPGVTVVSNLVGRAAHNCQPRFIEALINACANVNASHETGPRPLDLAIRQNCTEAVTLLEAAGAVVADPVPPPKKTYANLAFAAVEADEATINEMIANGFRNDINRQSSRGQTALWVAVDYQNVGAVRALLNAGANVDFYDNGGNHILHKIANAKNANGNFAYSQNLGQIAELIWQKCPIRRPRDAQGKTPLDLITRNARTESGRAIANQTLTVFQAIERIHNGPAQGSNCP